MLCCDSVTEKGKESPAKLWTLESWQVNHSGAPSKQCMFTLLTPMEADLQVIAVWSLVSGTVQLLPHETA